MLPLYSPSLVGQVAFNFCFLTWVLLELWVNLRPNQPGSTQRDFLSRYAILGSMMVAFALAGLATSLDRWEVGAGRAAVFYSGLFLMLVGLLVRWLAIRQLGRYFVPEVAIQPGQPLLETGLYRYVRHPAYTGSFITIVGYGLALTNWFSLLLMVAVPAPAWAFRILVEERALLDAFGPAYGAYMQRTWRLIPFVV